MFFNVKMVLRCNDCRGRRRGEKGEKGEEGEGIKKAWAGGRSNNSKRQGWNVDLEAYLPENGREFNPAVIH